MTFPAIPELSPIPVPQNSIPDCPFVPAPSIPWSSSHEQRDTPALLSLLLRNVWPHWKTRLENATGKAKEVREDEIMLLPSPAAAAQPSPAATRTRSQIKPFPKLRTEIGSGDNGERHPKAPGDAELGTSAAPTPRFQDRNQGIDTHTARGSREDVDSDGEQVETEPHLCFHSYPTRAEVLRAPPAPPSHVCPPKNRASP